MPLILTDIYNSMFSALIISKKGCNYAGGKIANKRALPYLPYKINDFMMLFHFRPEIGASI